MTEKERIFEQFYRIDKSRLKENEGADFEFSIVKHTSKYYDATILLKNEPEKRSSFTVFL